MALERQIRGLDVVADAVSEGSTGKDAEDLAEVPELEEVAAGTL